jgi:hypothetical protein
MMLQEWSAGATLPSMETHIHTSMDMAYLTPTTAEPGFSTNRCANRTPTTSSTILQNITFKKLPVNIKSIKEMLQL